MASQNIARLGVILGIDTAEWTAELNKAIEEHKKFKRQIQSQNTAAENWLGEGYYSYNLSPGLVAAISAAYNTVGLPTNSSVGHLWNATWGAGSTIASGVVKFGFYDGGGNPASAYIDIQAIDTADTNYQQPNNNAGTSLVGTFLFPATFTIYDPLTNKSGWC